jgi:hypothetical protein
MSDLLSLSCLLLLLLHWPGGLDSLGAVEYVNLVGRRLKLQLPSTLVFDYPTVDAVTSFLTGKLAAQQPPAAAAAQKAAAPARTAMLPRAVPAAAPAAAAAPALPISIMGSLLWPLAAGASGSAAAASSGPLGLIPQQDCIITIPGNRWNPDVAAGVASDVAGSVAATRFGAFLQDVEQFDAAAFGLGAAEAVATDPQHRLLLASAAQLLSTPGAFADTIQPGMPSAAISSSSSSSSSDVQRSMSDTGVFVGISWTEYFQLGRMLGQPMGANTAQGAVLSVACGR